jgi:L-alanine-DL-glutamate epimerase-like enolase superfamily enzyme
LINLIYSRNGFDPGEVSSLKITKIEIIPVNLPKKKVLTLSRYGKLGEGTPFEFILTRVHTDEGFIGVGECPPLPPLSPENQGVVTEMIRRWIAPNVIGMDPFDLEGIWEKMDYWAPTYPMAKAAVDMALWDIMGRSLNVPVYKLLGGGSNPSKMPNVALIGIDTPEKVAAEGKRLVKEGYTGIRLKIGPKRDIKCVGAIRKAIGDDTTLRVDCNQGYSTSDAIKMIRDLEQFSVELIEQPTVWWDFASLAKVAGSVDTPIMPHESLFSIADVKTLIDMGAVGVLGLKTYRPAGGITNVKRILDMARILNIPTLMHDDLEMGVSLSVASHIIAGCGKAITQKCELSGYPEWINEDVIKEPVKLEGGYIAPPKGPGLGFELNEAMIKKYTTGIITLG